MSKRFDERAEEGADDRSARLFLRSLAFTLSLSIAACGRLDYDTVPDDAGGRMTDARTPGLDTGLVDGAPLTDAAGPDGRTDAVAQDGSVDTGASDPLLVAWYPMDADAVGGSVVDATGHGHTGSCTVGSTCPVLVAGELGAAYAFDGVSAGVRVASSAELETTAGFTLSLWFRPVLGSSTGVRHLLAKPLGPGSPNNTWELYLVDGVPRVSSYNGTRDDSVSASGVAAAGVWMHLAATWDGTNLSLYLDGTLLGSTPANPTFTGTDVLMGVDEDLGTEVHFFDGALDDVRIYRAPLDATTLYALAHP